jgi:acyl-coenzyme A thioesterase PaaI-like protein
MKELPHTHSCFVCGESNAIGFRLRFETDGRIVQTRFCPSPEHIGFKNVMHGGLIATVLDEVMVWACAVATRRFAFCAELAVRFLNPVRPGEELMAVGELAANRKGKIFEAKGILRNSSGTTLAEATGKYLPIKADDAAAMATDFVGDAKWVLGGN